MSASDEPRSDTPRRRVPKDPFANLPPAPPPRRAAPPPRDDPPPSKAMVRVDDPERERTRNYVDDVRAPRRREPEPERDYREANDPPRRKRAPEPEPYDEEPPRRRRAAEPVADDEAPPQRRRAPADEYADDPPPRPRSSNPFAEDDQAPRRPSRPDPRPRDYPDDPEPPRGRRPDPRERDYPEDEPAPRPRPGKRQREYPEEKKANPWQTALKWFRYLLDFANLIYLVALVAVIVLMELEGEGNPYTAPLLYLPTMGWLVPILPLGFLCLIFRRWWLVIHFACAAGILMVYMKYQLKEPRLAHGQTLTILSNNIGENHGKSFAPFADAEKADVIALQDAGGRGKQFTQIYTNHYVAAASQFVLISKFPIKKADILPYADGENVPVAACFEIEFEGKPVAIYSVHLPTARAHLEALKGLGGLAMLFGSSGGHGHKVKEDSAQFWAHQLSIAKGIATQIAQDKRPLILCGDFNGPDHGLVYGQLAGHLTDAHRACGQGYGFSFPADGRFPPWLRLDQIHSSEQLVPVYSRTEPDRRSQHRSVVARFELQK